MNLLRSATEIFEVIFRLPFSGPSIGQDKEARAVWKTVLLSPISVIIWIFKSLIAVVLLLFSFASFDAARKRSLLFGLPSLTLFLVLTCAMAYSLVTKNRVERKYRDRLQKALVAKDLLVAKSISGRLVSTAKSTDLQTRLQYAVILRESGERERADAILKELAPDDKPGMATAHRFRARAIAESPLTELNRKSKLEQLRWHLENSGEESDLLTEQLWTNYYLSVGQPNEAMKHLEIAAQLSPRLNFSLANFYMQMGNKAGENRALRAQEEFEIRQLKSSPLSREDRIILALCQNRLGKISSAEQTILTGIQIDPDPVMRRAGSDFFLVRYDELKSKSPKDISGQFKYLQKALELDIQNFEIYNRFITLYEVASSSDQAESIKASLENMIVDGATAGLAHFALSSIYLIEKNAPKAEFHLNQSYQSSAALPVVANNLAWMLAHSAEPDLDRAIELVSTAMKADPSAIAFRDTYATILMKQDKINEAIAEFERILPSLQDPSVAHRKLAEMYRKIGQDSLAGKHEEKAKQLNN